MTKPDDEEDKGAVGPGPLDGDKGVPDAKEADADDKAPVDPTALMVEQMRALQAEIRDLRASRAAPAAEPPKQPEPEPEPDWNKLIFDNPTEALRLHGERVSKKVRAELQTQYQNDQNQRQFWNGFFEQNPDLTPDRDLVETTLQANLGELGGMPVEKASARLADLTRERILRYSGKSNGGMKKKPQAEGANPPRGAKKIEEPPKPVTLSEIIKSRRARHSAPLSGNRGSAA